MHSMEKDSSMYLFDRRNQPGVIWPYGPLRLLSGPLNSRKLLLLVFMWTPTCNSFNAKRFIHISLRLNKSVRRKLLSLVFMLTLRLIHESVWLNKSVRGHMALSGYCLGPCTGESCCHWCFCKLQHVIVSMQKVHSCICYLFDWINQLGAYHGPLWLLSGPLYRRKLLSLVFIWTLRCNSFNAKRFIHVSFRLNNVIWVWTFGATVWGQVQEKIAFVAIFNISTSIHPWVVCYNFYLCIASAE